MNCQIISDIHLEYYNHINKSPLNKIEKTADIIALCGDIGYPGSSIYHDFIASLSEKYELVLLVTGNHEYYHTSKRKWSYEKIHDHIYEFTQQFDNVHFLNKSTLKYKGIKFMGCTLWTNIDKKYKEHIQFTMNDYNKITISNNNYITPNTTQYWHNECVSWLTEEFKEEVPTVVFTHHPPSNNPIVGMKKDEKIYSVYTNDLESIIPNHVLLWGYGHTHKSADFIATNGITRIVSNPYGYKIHEHPDDFGIIKFEI